MIGAQRVSASALAVATIGVLIMATRQAPHVPVAPVPAVAWVPAHRMALGGIVLEDDAGAPFGGADWGGRWSVIVVGYTSCPDVCPTALARLAEAMHGDPDLRGLFIAVDPVRDRRQLTTYVRWFHPALHGLTGTPAALERAVGALGASYSVNPDGTIDHSTAFFIVDPAGEVAGAIAQPRDGAAVLAGVAALRQGWGASLVGALWVPPGPGAVGAAYGVLANPGARPVTIVGVRPLGPGRAELHQTIDLDGTARMRSVEAITIAPGAAWILRRGGHHIMLTGGAANADAVELLTVDGAVVRIPLSGRGGP